MTQSITQLRYPVRSVIDRETHTGMRIAALLDERTEAIPHDTQVRLRFAREQAVARAVRIAAERQAASGSVAYAWGRHLTLGLHPRWLTLLGSALPLALLLGGLALIDEWHDQAQIYAVAEVDTDLLNDELPPLAYSDPGFAEFLKVSHD